MGESTESSLRADSPLSHAHERRRAKRSGGKESARFRPRGYAARNSRLCSNVSLPGESILLYFCTSYFIFLVCEILAYKLLLYLC